MTAEHFWKETRFVKEHARRDKKSVFHGAWKVPFWERGRLHAKEMSACKTNVLKRPEIGQPSARALDEGKCKRLFKIQSVPEIYAKYVLRNSWYPYDSHGDASWFARSIYKLHEQSRVSFPREFLIRGISRTYDGTMTWYTVSRCYFIRAQKSTVMARRMRSQKRM